MTVLCRRDAALQPITHCAVCTLLPPSARQWRTATDGGQRQSPVRECDGDDASRVRPSNPRPRRRCVDVVIFQRSHLLLPPSLSPRPTSPHSSCSALTFSATSCAAPQSIFITATALCYCSRCSQQIASSSGLVSAAVRLMFSATGLSAMTSGFFRSLRSAFRQPVAQSIACSAASDCSDPPPAIESHLLLPLLALFRPSNVADTLILAAHYARTERWDSVEAIYCQLEEVLQLQGNGNLAASAPTQPSSAYAPLVAPLSSAQCDAWLVVVQQCQRDAKLLQSLHSSSHIPTEHHNGTTNAQSEKHDELSSAVVVGKATSQPILDALHQEQQQQWVDGTQGSNVEQHENSMADTTEERVSDEGLEAVVKQRKRQRARKPTKGQWGEMMAPPRKRTRRQTRQRSKAKDAEGQRTDTLPNIPYPVNASLEGAVAADALQTDAIMSDDRHESKEAAPPDTVDGMEIADAGAADKQESGSTVPDEQLAEGDQIEDASGATAAATLRSRWKRPCKRLVRFRVVAGEEEQRQIEAQQEEYFKLNGGVPTPSSTEPGVERPTLATSDLPPTEPAISSGDTLTVDPPLADHTAIHPTAAGDAQTDMSAAAVVDPDYPPSLIDSSTFSLSSSSQLPPISF